MNLAHGGASLGPVSGAEPDVVAALADWVESGSEPLMIRTSGSTGEPKDVELSKNAVLASASATHHRLGGAGQWLLALPVTSIAGIQVVVRSLLAGVWPVRVAEFSSLSRAVSSITASSIRAYASVVPTQLHRMGADGSLGDLAALDAVLVGGASLDDDLLRQAREHDVNIVRTYGMTETCGGCVYDGVPLDGVHMAIDDDGQVLLSGEVLFSGYRHTSTPGLQNGWFYTGDLGRIDDGRLIVTGREDDVAVSGGVNISLPSVRDAVRRLDGVHQVEVLGVPDAEWGSKVVAFIVPRDAVCLDGLRLDQVRDAVGDADLPREWAPKSVVLCDSLPLLDSGKIDRQALRAQAH